MTVLRFLTTNLKKAAEFQALFSKTQYEILSVSPSIDEIQTEDMNRLVVDKALKAFAAVRRPLFVDHTGLYFDLLNGLPGGLTASFWGRLRNDGIAKLIGGSQNNRVRAVTLIGYCDGKVIKTFSGEVWGTVPSAPKGPEGFQWDPIFVPDGYTETFAELGAKKNEISMRRKAVDAFIGHLDGFA